MINKWDDITTKYSHPNKPLWKHLEEVETIFNIFTKYYEIQGWAIDLMLPVITCHDYGKLNPAWNVSNLKNPPHSEYSIQYIKEKNLYKTVKKQQPKLYPLILYLILKHHSALYDRSSCKDEVIKKICTDITRMIVTKLPMGKRIEIADAFGIFKLADSLSASNKAAILPQAPELTLNAVKKFLSSKTGSLDEKRWIEQQSLIHLPDAALLTAYTGWGKTDSSLLYCTNPNVKKIFYLFPMITAINKFYDKLSSFVLNGVEKYFYLYEYEIATKYGESPDESSEFNISSFIASHFLSPIVLTTVDQFLLAFLQLGKYYMKRVMFRNAAIIVDEVHLLNPKMLVLLLRFLKNFMPIYRFRILFMSATFSNALMQVVKDYLPQIEIMDLSKGYQELLRVKYDLTNIGTTIQEDIEKIEKYVKPGNNLKPRKVLVVANTVETAVSVFRGLEEQQLPYPLLLLHGKFMYKDRVVKENKIDDLKNTPHILVTTQVCEVSLDASYDTLLTEVAPLPSLIQRFGRVNRYGRRTNHTNVFIYKEHRKEGSGNNYPYEEDDIRVAKQILEDINPLSSEYDLIKKFNEVETYETLSNRINEAEKLIDFEALWGNDERTAYFFSFKLNEEDVRKRLLEFRESITVNILPDPVCIGDDDTKTELENLLNKWNKRSISNREEINKILKTIRGYLVSIPIWLAAKYRNKDDAVLPILNPNNLTYYGKYGFIEKI